MLRESLNDYFIIAAVVLGIFSILLVWIYLLEAGRGIYITDIVTYKKYINLTYAFSVIILVILWLTTEEMDDKLLKCFWGLSSGWTITFFVSLMVSMVIKGRMEDKKSMREAILPCISKLIILVIVLWLVF